MAADTEKRILAAALEVFHEKCYERASTREIAERAQISKSALYHHFRSKEDILFALLQGAVEEMNRSLSNETDPEPSGESALQESLIRMMQAYTSNFAMNRFVTNILVHDREYLSETLKAYLVQQEKQHVGQLRKLLQHSQTAGELKAHLNPSVMTFSLLGMIHWLYYWVKPDGELSLEQIIGQVIEIFLYGAGA